MFYVVVFGWCSKRICYVLNKWYQNISTVWYCRPHCWLSVRHIRCASCFFVYSFSLIYACRQSIRFTVVDNKYFYQKSTSRNPYLCSVYWQLFSAKKKMWTYVCDYEISLKTKYFRSLIIRHSLSENGWRSFFGKIPAQLHLQDSRSSLRSCQFSACSAHAGHKSKLSKLSKHIRSLNL